MSDLRLVDAGAAAPDEFDFALDADNERSLPPPPLRILNLGTGPRSSRTIFDADADAAAAAASGGRPLNDLVMPSDAADSLRNRYVARIGDRALAANYRRARLEVEALRNAAPPPPAPLLPSVVASEARLAQLVPAVDAAVRPLYIADLRTRVRSLLDKANAARAQLHTYDRALQSAQRRIEELNAATLRAHGAYVTNSRAMPHELERLAEQLREAEQRATETGVRFANARQRLVLIGERLERTAATAATAAAAGDDNDDELVRTLRSISDAITAGDGRPLPSLSAEQQAALGASSAADYAAAVRVRAEARTHAEAYEAARAEAARLRTTAQLLGASFEAPRSAPARAASSAHTLDIMRTARANVRAEKRRMYAIEQEMKELRAIAAEREADADAVQQVLAAATQQQQ